MNRVRFLREEPYSQKEAEAAVGLRTDNGTRNSSKIMKLEEQLAIINVGEAQGI